ncbi:MAG: hypothetical protein NT178_18405 [Proteobacteria bacterium]|nr:hypothetical protein [Pseudomonadota bacterium]
MTTFNPFDNIRKNKFWGLWGKDFSWDMEAWSIGAAYKMYMAGEKFFRYYKQLKESVYKEKSELELVE